MAKANRSPAPVKKTRARPTDGVYTTGNVAKILKISLQSVIRAVDDKKLVGSCIPGSKFRKIEHQDLIKYMKENGLTPAREWRSVIFLVPAGHVEATRIVERLRDEHNILAQICTNGWDVRVKLDTWFAGVVVIDARLCTKLGWKLKELIEEVRAKSTDNLPQFLVIGKNVTLPADRSGIHVVPSEPPAQEFWNLCQRLFFPWSET